MFCCGCLNTEATLGILDENQTRAIRELLGLKDHDRYLYEYMCWMCYAALMKSIKFKEQCLEARNMVLSMVNVSRESLNTFHMSNFKPKLTQSKVVLTNVEPALETNEGSFFPFIREIKSEVPDEGTLTDVNETSHDVKIILTEDNILSNEYDVKSCKEFIKDDEIAAKTVLFVPDKKLKEEIVVKEEYSDQSQEESVDITAVESGNPLVHETPMKKILEKPDRIYLELIDTRPLRRDRTFNQIPQTKRIKLDETSTDTNTITNVDLKRWPTSNCRALDVSFTKNFSVNHNLDVSMSKEIMKSTVNCYEVNKISPKVNILPRDKVQVLDVIVQDYMTPQVCYSNTENETFKQWLPNSVDAVAPSTSLNRSDEGNITNVCNKKESNNLTCYTYPNKCVTGNIVNIHIPKKTKQKQYLCDLCDYRCSRKTYLNTHTKYKHTMEKNFSCHMCEYKCVTKGALNTHVKYKHTKEKTFSCHMCQYKCVTKSGLIVHLRKHTGDKPFICDLCDSRFSSASNLRSHIKFKHIKENTFSCHMCQYKCVNKINLSKHLRRHTGEKPYTCDLCDKKFSIKSELNIHIKYKHTKEKNFSCHICPYKCVTKGALNRHLRNHTGEKPYTCDLCEYKFPNRRNLRDHITFKHAKEKIFSCHMCEFKCGNKAGLNRHLRSHNGDKPYACDLCDYRCSEKGYLNSHIKFKHTKEKNFSCHICQYKCVTKSTLNRHLHKHTGE